MSSSAPNGKLLSELVLRDTRFAVHAGQQMPMIFYVDGAHVTPEAFQARLALAMAIEHHAHEGKLTEAVRGWMERMDQGFPARSTSWQDPNT